MNINKKRRKLPKIKKESKRHKTVGRLVLTSLAITSVFGINSFFFSYTQNKLSGSIENVEALDALQASSATDQISTIADLKRNYLSCKSSFPSNCETYFTTLIQTRNRIKDYQIAFNETLGLSKEDPLYGFMSYLYKDTDIVAKKSFGLSFEEAKEKKIRNASQYIKLALNRKYSLVNYNSSNENLINSINILYKDIDQWIELKRTSSKSIPSIMGNVNIAYLILVFSEIGLFILVAVIDILNNNIVPEINEVN